LNNSDVRYVNSEEREILEDELPEQIGKWKLLKTVEQLLHENIRTIYLRK